MSRTQHYIPYQGFVSGHVRPRKMPNGGGRRATRAAVYSAGRYVRVRARSLQDAVRLSDEYFWRAGTRVSVRREIQRLRARAGVRARFPEKF